MVSFPDRKSTAKKAINAHFSIAVSRLASELRF